MEFSISEMFGYFSSFLGLLLSAVILAKMKGKTTIRTSLVSVLLLNSFTIFLGVLNFSGKMVFFPHLLRIDSPIHFLLGPSVYFYTLSRIKKDFKFRYYHLLHLLPFAINLLEFIPFYFSDTTDKLNYYNNLMDNGTIVIQRNYLFKTISGWSYFIAQIYVFVKYFKPEHKIRRYHKFFLSWFIIYFGSQFICFTGLLFDHVTGLNVFPDPYKFGVIMVSFLLLTIALALLFFPRVLYGNISLFKSENEKYSHSHLSEEYKDELLSSWLKFVRNKNKPFLNPKLSISEVAHLLNTSPQRLSQVINEKTGMHFNDYINHLRVEESKKLLESDVYFKITIETIAIKSGFNSKSPFYTSFKKFTGMTPREYVKLKNNRSLA
jgi:AraC-like DNA-binding protein